MPRDNQKSRLYDAEREALASAPLSATGQRYLSMDTVHDDYGYLYASVQSTQAYVDAVRTSAKFQRRWGYRGLIVTHNANRSRGGGGVLHMSAQHRRREWAILHEIAHNLSSYERYSPHGPEFAATLLTLVDLVMGKDHAAALRASFAKHRVKYRAGMSTVPKPSAARLAKARDVRITRAKPTKAVTPEKVAARKARAAEPMTYERCYDAGRRSSTGDASIAMQGRPGFDADAYYDGYLDEAAGRERFHLRDCEAHHNDPGGCGVA